MPRYAKGKALSSDAAAWQSASCRLSWQGVRRSDRWTRGELCLTVNAHGGGICY